MRAIKVIAQESGEWGGYYVYSNGVVLVGYWGKGRGVRRISEFGSVVEALDYARQWAIKRKGVLLAGAGAPGVGADSKNHAKLV